jgi:hypothetical protein
VAQKEFCLAELFLNSFYTDLAKRLFWIGVHLTNRTTPSVGESIGCVRMLRLWDRCDLYGERQFPSPGDAVDGRHSHYVALSAAFGSLPHHRQETGDQQNGTVRSTCMYSSPAEDSQKTFTEPGF